MVAVLEDFFLGGGLPLFFFLGSGEVDFCAKS